MSNAGPVPRRAISVTRALCAVALTVLAAIAGLFGCSNSQTPSATSLAASPAVGSAAGEYRPGDSLTLANGDGLTVPTGWVATLFARGAFMATATAQATGWDDSGGGGVFLRPYVGEIFIGVYGPLATEPVSFVEKLSEDERMFLEARNGTDAGVVTSSDLKGPQQLVTFGKRVALHLSADATITAYVFTTSARPSNPKVSTTRKIDVFVETPGDYPLLIGFDLHALPTDFREASDAELPLLLLKYIGFKPR